MLQAVHALADLVRPHLGPDGVALPTATGPVKGAARLLSRFRLQHPLARLVLQSCQDLASELGDGSTSLVLLVDALVTHAERLVARGVPRERILSTWHTDILPRSLQHLAELSTQHAISRSALAADSEAGDDSVLWRIAQTACACKSSFPKDRSAASACQAAVLRAGDALASVSVLELVGLHPVADQLVGARLHPGIALDTVPAATTASHRMEHVDAVLLACTIGPDATASAGGGVSVSNLDDAARVAASERQRVRQAIAGIQASGARAVLTSETVSDAASAACARQGILVWANVPRRTLERLARGLGVPIATTLSPSRVPRAGQVSRIDVDYEASLSLLYLLHESAAVSTLLASAMDWSLLRDGLTAALTALQTSVLDGGAVPGAGGAERCAAKHLQADDALASDRATAAVVGATCEAFETIPGVLNTSRGAAAADSVASGTLDSLRVKTGVWRAAFLTAQSVLRVRVIITPPVVVTSATSDAVLRDVERELEHEDVALAAVSHAETMEETMRRRAYRRPAFRAGGASGLTDTERGQRRERDAAYYRRRNDAAHTDDLV